MFNDKERIMQWLTTQTSWDLEFSDTSRPVQGTIGATVHGEHKINTVSEGEDLFTDPKNLPNAVATILNTVMKKANFYPGTMKPKEIGERFPTYLKEVLLVPFFHLEKTETIIRNFKHKDYNGLIDNVTQVLDAIETKDKEELKNRIKTLGQSVFTDKTAENWDNIFAHNALIFPSIGTAKMTIIDTALHMKHEQKKSEVNEQDYELRMIVIRVLPEVIKQYSKQLMALTATDVDNWLQQMNTPINPAIKLCYIER